MPRMRDRVATERYEIGLPETGMPKPRISYPSNNAAFSAATYGAAEAQAFGGLAEPFNKLAIAIRAKEDEYDKLRVEDANTQYQKALLDLTKNPETGLLNVRQGFGAKNVTQDFEGEAAKIREKLSKDMKLTKRQMDLFGVVSGKSTLPFTKSVMDYEAAQYQKYKDETYTAGQEANVEAVMSDPTDQTMYETQKQLILGMAATRFGDEMGGEQFKRYTQELLSGVETERIKAVALADPYLAKQMINGSVDLLPTQRAALEKVVFDDIETLEVQAVVDGYLDEFGTSDPTAAYAWARDNFSGSKEEKVVSAFREQMGERDITENRREQEMKEMSREKYNELDLRYWSNGLPAPAAEINMLATSSEKAGAMNRNNQMLTRAGIQKYLRTMDPDYINMSFEEQEALQIQEFAGRTGRTEAMRKEVLDMIDLGIAQGTVTADEINNAYDYFDLTLSEKSSRLEALKLMNKDRLDAISNESAGLTTDLQNLFGGLMLMDNPQRNGIIKAASNEFTTQMGKLNPKDPEYKEKLRALRSGIAINAYDQVYSKQDTYWKNFLDAGKVELDQRLMAPVDTYKPDLFRSNFVIPDRAQTTEISTPPLPTTEFNQQVIPGSIVTSSYGTQGPNRTSPHTGTDLAAPKGTPINFAFSSGDWRMVRQYTGKNEGNTKVVTGTMPNGDTAEIQYMHMDNLNEGAKVGDVMTPTSLIGPVGNTGRVRGVNGGYHAHIQCSINGRRVDWETDFVPYMQNMASMQSGNKMSKYLLPIAEQQRMEREHRSMLSNALFD